MKVKELISKLTEFPMDREVYLFNKGCCDNCNEQDCDNKRIKVTEVWNCYEGYNRNKSVELS